MFPLGRIIYLPLLGPISTDFSPSPTIPLYINNSYNLSTTTKFEHNVFQKTVPHRFKRIRDDVHDLHHRKRPKLTSTNNNSSTLSKNALMLLYELKPSIEYKLIAQTGPSHRPMFTMAVEINGQVFEGVAQTKKEAKQAAAEKALRSLPFPISNPSIEKTESESSLNPLDLLNKLKQDIQFEEITDNITSEQYKYAINLDNQRFIGTGLSKQIAKTKAAQIALEKLFGMCFDKQGDPSIENHHSRDLADRIAICIQEKFNQLTQHDVRLQRRKVLSGIVLTYNYNLESMKVICITTGTKCMNGNRMTVNGQSLNDCHAEIIARRCLIRYCYEQLRLLIDGKSDESIFEKIDNTNRFRVKKSIDFHLYISTAPCGDSRLFSPQEVTTEKSSCQDLTHSLRKSRGLLRTKIEVTEGTIPVLAKTIYQNVQTSDEILNNERLLTMSCSDKLCRWNFIGLQGALLSTLIDPIYLTSIIIGSLYHSENIRRALFSRIEQRVNQIPAPYGLRRPFISGVSNPEMRNTIRAPNHSFIWNCVDEKCEIIDTFSGLTISRESSTISKAALFQQWTVLMNKIKPGTIPTVYCDAKQLAVDYQTAKMEVNKAFQKGGFGLWIRKPHKQEEFNLSSSDVSSSSYSDEAIPFIN